MENMIPKLSSLESQELGNRRNKENKSLEMEVIRDWDMRSQQLMGSRTGEPIIRVV